MMKASDGAALPRALSIEEVMVQTGLGRTTIYEAIKLHGLKARKMGRRTIVFADDLKSWLASLPLYSAA